MRLALNGSVVHVLALQIDGIYARNLAGSSLHGRPRGVTLPPRRQAKKHECVEEEVQIVLERELDEEDGHEVVHGILEPRLFPDREATAIEGSKASRQVTLARSAESSVLVEATVLVEALESVLAEGLESVFQLAEGLESAMVESTG
ncbi:expressed unknown protein [Seminavis robusta]|uniref:Uncharacterized protein n=1 Tax=Seminavis robusta TaxID=568900 RepID=A0A9N8E3B1_9STRA|nr:expressed unknown protein [Seminavis robusta]|eukprot:Sro615_g175840.1 n/a (147) ;mRNA; r:36929-37517